MHTAVMKESLSFGNVILASRLKYRDIERRIFSAVEYLVEASSRSTIAASRLHQEDCSSWVLTVSRGTSESLLEGGSVSMTRLTDLTTSGRQP